MNRYINRYRDIYINININKYLKKYALFIIFIIIILIGLAALGRFNTTLWHTINAMITISTVIGVWYNYYQNQKQLEEVDIFLKFTDGYEKKIYRIKRKNFSRAELKGMLRELHNSKENYKLSYMSEDEFLTNVFNIQDGLSNKFYMEIRESDFFEYKR